MAINVDIMCIKKNTIPHVDAQSKLKFGNEKVENHENEEEKILHWVEINVLFLPNRLRIEVRQDPVLSQILERIRNIGNTCSMAERPFKENIVTLSIKLTHLQ